MSLSSKSPVPTLTTQPSIYSPQPVYHPNVRSPSLHSRALSDFETASKASSLLGPPLARDPSSVASNSTAGYLPTPTDDVMRVPPPLSRDETTLTAYYRNQAFPEQTGQHGLTRKNRVVPGTSDTRTRQRPVSIHMNSPTRDHTGMEIATSSGMDTSSSSERGDVPQDLVSMPPRMERQRAARDLISRYEDLDSAAHVPVTPSGSQRSPSQGPRSVSSVPQMSRRDLSLPPIPPTNTPPSRNQSEAKPTPPRVPHSHCLPESPSYFSFARKGGKLRNSFTNLVQLLGDKAKSKDHFKKRNSISPSVSPNRTFNALPKGFKLRLSKRASATSSPSSSPGKVEGKENSSKILPDMNELLKSEPIVTTLLLYQSPVRQVHPSIPDQRTPLWMPYTVSLYSTTMILQVPNPGLSSSSKFQIPLSELYDAHSIAVKDLPPGSIPLPGSISLPSGFEGDIYVFEAQCYGGRIERFAAPTMALRTTWVRHLLDILAGKHPDSKDERNLSNKEEEIAPLTCNIRPGRSPGGIRGLPTEPRLTFPPSPAESLPTLVSLARDIDTTANSIEPTTDSNSSVEERSPPSLMKPSTPTMTFSGTLDSGSSGVTGARQVTSVLPNPWDSPATPSRRPTSVMVQRTSSLLMSPRTDRSGMTSSPSICRLDERNLVRNRLAMLERHNSASPSENGSIRSRTKEGSVNWEALSEIRRGRSGSGLSRTTSDMCSPGIKSPLGATEMAGGVSPSMNLPGNNRTLSKPVWPFPESITLGHARVSRNASLNSDGLVLEPGASLDPFSTTGPNTAPGRSRQVGTPLLSLPKNRTLKPESKLVQVLGNLPPSNRVGRISSRPTSQPMEASTQYLSSQLVLDRLNTLVSALRESDIAHSTKASGLGQLIASTQDHIVRAVEDSTILSTKEHVELVGRVEGLRGMVESLAARPSLGAEERADLLSIKEIVERIDRIIPAKLEDLTGERGESDREEMKRIIIDRADGIKQTIQDLALKLDWASAQNDVLSKLDALTETVAGVSSTLDLELMAEFVQQVKSHILSLPSPTSESPTMDISAIMEKLDTISKSLENTAAPTGLSGIQATLEDIRELSRTQQTSDQTPASAVPPSDISDVLMKLDGITAMCQSIMEVRANAPDSETNSGDSQEAQRTLLSALKEDAEHRTAQAQQTAELVRYSNELNAWLEKFVTNAAAQMDGVGAGLGSLRRDLGLDPPRPADGQEDGGMPPQGVIQELRGMFEEQIKSAGDIAVSLNSLLVAFNEEQARNLQTRESLATDSVLKMIEVQRQEQERLLKQLASDLSSDIRGERIRFVEAMSQATSMNVQLHVEEFKRQLTHEVLALTDEVGRLREERKTIQHQIAQLFLVKSEHEAERHPSDAPRPPPRPLSSTRPSGR